MKTESYRPLWLNRFWAFSGWVGLACLVDPWFHRFSHQLHVYLAKPIHRDPLVRDLVFDAFWADINSTRAFYRSR